ncbi:MAG: hypothetical protein Unbinned5784contig1000_44 [Prokaryotic dsDNA virus sp.]|nr:MAG: hypothetical protein Unbinned5784contig1000_44 [Prokaryotic dsDNA virus sp.]|tara:strand:- start:75 stop:413 length:339 start_codon:yes stop_codon:yes gene_type:complete
MRTWNQITATFPVGRLIKDGAYRITETTEKRIRLERVATGSLVTISRKMVEKAAARLASDTPCDCGCGTPGAIKKRAISYTVAIETIVVICLGSTVALEDIDGAAHYVGAQS